MEGLGHTDIRRRRNPQAFEGGRWESDYMKYVSMLMITFAFATGCARSPSFTETDKWIGADAPGPTVSVCYSAAESTREQVMAFALAKCSEDHRALTLIDEDSALNNCPLLKRQRVTFSCVTPGSQGQVFP